MLLRGANNLGVAVQSHPVGQGRSNVHASGQATDFGTDTGATDLTIFEL